MTASEVAITGALRRAAIRATHAYSVLDTQPWRFDLRRGRLDVLADPERRLEALDPVGRQLAISLGCALFDSRVALAAAGMRPVITLLPDPVQQVLAARVEIDDEVDGAYIDPIAVYDTVVEHRQSDSTDLEAADIPAELLAAIEKAADEEGVAMRVVRGADLCSEVNRLSREAQEIQSVDPACRAELRAWTRSGEARPEYSTGAVPCQVVLGTERDDREHWLRTGEALERSLLEITRRGFAASPAETVVEVPSTRLALRSELGLPWYPQVLLRVGRASLRAHSRRRRLVDVLFETL